MPAKGKKDTFAPLRWTIERACSEFSINPRTLAKRLKVSGDEPGKDKKWATMQIASAVFGNLYVEQLRNERLDGDIKERKVKAIDRDMMATSQVLRAWEVILVGLRQKILFLEKLSEDEKRELLLDLQKIPVDEYFKDDKPIEEVE